MLWKVGLITAAATAAMSARDISSGRGFDAAGMLVNNTDISRGLDSAGIPFNNTDFLRMSEEEIVFDSWNSITERKAGSPTISCTLAGGYCVKTRKSLTDCNGTVDPKGCKGNKYKCCIPDQTTPPPPTCPVVTCATCPTCVPITTPDQTTPPPPTCPVVTCAPCPTSVPITTPGPNLNWLSVGADRFIRMDQNTTNWNHARALCRGHGLDLYHPRDILAVSKYLDENFSDGSWGMWHWLGARGNGTHQVWFSGVVLTRDDPWYSNYYTRVGTNDCLYSITHSGLSERGQVLAAYDCIRIPQSSPKFYPLCG